MMQRIVIHQFGGPELLTLEAVARPEPAAAEVVVATAYAALNPIDLKTRQGLGWAAAAVGKRGLWPFCPGYDLAGTVVAAGADSGWQIGDRVCGLVNFPLPAGCYAEQVAVVGDELVAVPVGLSLQQAAALPLAALTAAQALALVSREPGRLAVLGAAGAVGQLVVQLARHAGWQVVAVGRHCPHSLAEVVTVDAIIDLIGGDPVLPWLAVMAEHGQLVTVPTLTAPALIAAAETRGLNGAGLLVTPERPQLERLLQLAAAGQLQLAIAGCWPLAEAAQAQRQLAAGGGKGKVLLQLAGES